MTSRRQSCDRCHGQKLRCTRPDNRRTGACDRCLRKGTQCAYSSSLPKGRPSLYRPSETVPGAPNASLASQSAASSSSSSTPPGGTPEDGPDSPEVTPISPFVSATPLRPDRQPLEANHFDTAHTHVSMDLQGGGAFDMPNTMDNFTQCWAPWWQDDEAGDNMLDIIPSNSSAFNLDPALEAQAVAGLEVATSALNGTDGVLPSIGNNLSDPGQGHTLTGGPIPDNNDSAAVGNSEWRDNVFTPPDDHSLELSMVHLSQLSTQLSQLLGCSRSFLSEALDPSRGCDNLDPALQVQLGIEAVFVSVNTWLVHGSPSSPYATLSSSNQPDMGVVTNSCNLLHNIFCASNHLEAILRHVAASAKVSSSTEQSASSDAVDSNCPSGPKVGSHAVEMGSAPAGRSRPPSSNPSHPSYSVVHHLALVCVTLLLNMYVAILIALQRSADALHSQQQQQQHQSSHTNNTGHHPSLAEPPEHCTVGATERVHLQLVSVVQLCSYFIRRQSRSLDVLKASGSSSQGQELRGEVEERLRLLQERLYI